MTKFSVGDTVRRKGDTSGRVRRIVEFYAMQIVRLDDVLDGWLYWNLDDLVRA